MPSPLTVLLALPAAVLAAAPTFTYGPASNYLKAPAVTASPTSNDLMITPTDVSNGIPDDGIDFFMGPDLQASLQNTLEGPCADGTLSQQCIDELSVALNQEQQYAIESRVVGALAALGSFAAAIVGITIGISKDRPKPLFSHVHLEPTDVTQMQSLTDTTAILATTSVGDFITVSVTTPVTTTAATSAPPATVTTLTADESGHKSGDVLIALPTQEADRFGEILRRAEPGCNPRSLKRRQSGNGPNYDGIANVGAIVMHTAPLDLLQGLGLQALDHLPRLKDTISQASLQTVQKAAAALDSLADLAAGARDVIAETVWIAAYDLCVYDQVTYSTLLLEDHLITDDAATDDDGGDDDVPAECPTDAVEKPGCESGLCAGDEDGRCTAGDDQGCPCLASATVYDHPGNRDFVEHAYHVLGQMFEIDTGDGSEPDDTAAGTVAPHGAGLLSCGALGYQGNEDHFFTLDAMTSAAVAFCDDQLRWPQVWGPVDHEVSENRVIREHINDHAGQDIAVSMTWMWGNMSCATLNTGSPGADEMCQDRLGTVINNCDTSNPDGVDRWKQGGWYQEDCVLWQIGYDPGT